MIMDMDNAHFLGRALDTWLTTSPDLIFIKDIDLNYITASLAFAKMTGHSCAAELVGKTDFDIFPPTLASKYTTDDRQVIESGISMVECVEPIPDLDDRKRYCSTSKFVITDDDGNKIGLLGISRDVTAQVELAQERTHSARLKVKSETDALTGLCNRDSIMNQVRECIEGYGANGNHAVLFVDLDCFKHVNDTLGHPYGDKVLQEIARKLMLLVRGSDLVGRVGGDEFLIFLRDISSRIVIESKAMELCKSIPVHIDEVGSSFDITCSVGIALYNGDGKSLEQLYSDADRAMYRAKESGRNSIAFY